ncbi:MAG: hypothetical protein J6R49_04455, partial [Clostridia bacterium]|nr:hypothetical protein [Clostridia bacterium]
YMQDSINWIKDGVFDGLILSLAEQDPDENDKTDLLSYQDGFVKAKSELFAAYTAKEKYFLVALETEKSFPSSVFAGAVSDMRAVNGDGFIAGSLSSFIAQKYGEYLQGSLLSGGAAAITAGDMDTAKEILEYAKTKINGFILALGGSDADTAAKALSKINNSLLILESRMLSYEEAKTLEGDIAMLYSASNAKRAVLSEFEALTKLCLLYREKTEQEAPPDISEPDVSEPDTSEPEINGSVEESLGESLGETSESSESEQVSIKLEFGDILVYLFVGLAFTVGLAAIIIGIKRKNTRPKNAHMPKASQREKKDEE